MVTMLQAGLKRAGRGALDFLFPPLCIACRAIVNEPGNLCPSCWQNVEFLDGPCCACCGLPFELDPGPGTRCAGCVANPPAFDSARAVMRYDDKSREPILAFKHADRLDLVPGFARWLARTGRPVLDEIDVIIPVPLHPRRLFSRRYNQSAELARALGGLARKPVAMRLLRRTRPTPSQGEMPSAKARRRNMQGAFRVLSGAKAALEDRAVLLIDDVFTTGATVEACARALKRAGAKKVHVLALARVVRPGSAII